MRWTLAERTRGMGPSVIREILKVTEQPGFISFGGGLPASTAFPVEAFAQACAKVLRDDGPVTLQYAASEGYGPLREQIAALLPWAVPPSQVLITHGSQQALDLVAKLLIDPGSRILVEQPTYAGALQAFAPMQPQMCGVLGDDSGVDSDDLARQCQAGGAPRFFYLQPNFQNPTGRLMSEARRAALVTQASALNLLLLEDNPYGELWFEQPPPLPLAARNPEGVIYLGSLSKVLAPGLRLGYLVAPAWLVPRLLQLKQAADLHTSGFAQRIAFEVMQAGFLERHTLGLRRLYAAQRDAMLSAMARHMPPGVRWSRPKGGMFLWVCLPQGLDAQTLLAQALAHQLAFVPGAPFYVQQPEVDTLRLSFATASAEQIESGIAVLGQLIRAAWPGPRALATSFRSNTSTQVEHDQ